MDFAGARSRPTATTATSLLLGAGSYLLSGASGSAAALSTSQPGSASLPLSGGPPEATSSQTLSSSTQTQTVASAAAAAAAGSINSDNGPILYNEPNRTSAIDDIRSVVLYIFIITIFFSFFLILPGIRNDKFPTFFCITTSLIVVSIILISLFGTSWHVAEAPISAAYKAFSRDRIQGELSVSIGLQSVNITLRAHKYYILHDNRGPMIMYNINVNSETLSATGNQQQTGEFRPSSLADELTVGRSAADGTTIDTELDLDEVFPGGESSKRLNRRATTDNNPDARRNSINSTSRRRAREEAFSSNKQPQRKYSVERLNVDINYNERFYFIGPEQMRQEHHKALERGLPYPILTVVEYLSQDEAGFSWSRQYRAAGYYSYIMLSLSLCVCVLMFILHCAAPKYGIYTMQLLGCLLLLTNLTYATLVPRADRKLVIPFEGRSLSFQFGWNFWAVSIGGFLSLVVGTLIVIIDSLFPNFIFTTILDVDFDSHHNYYRHRPRNGSARPARSGPRAITSPTEGPPFLFNPNSAKTTSSSHSAAAADTSYPPSANLSRLIPIAPPEASDSERTADRLTRRHSIEQGDHHHHHHQYEEAMAEPFGGRKDHYRAAKNGNLKGTHHRTADQAGPDASNGTTAESHLSRL